jgi:REP element-mobilizing transposase RayT
VPQSLARVVVHLIFSTKKREPSIHREVRAALHAYLTGILQNLQSPSLQTGGTVDHVHALFSLARTRSIAEVVEETKKSSSKWMKQQGVQGFAWQAGYGAFSVSESQVPAVIRYVTRQEEHHRRLTFQEEYRRFLDRYGVSYDERYVWD